MLKCFFKAMIYLLLLLTVVIPYASAPAVPQLEHSFRHEFNVLLSAHCCWHFKIYANNFNLGKSIHGKSNSFSYLTSEFDEHIEPPVNHAKLVPHPELQIPDVQEHSEVHWIFEIKKLS